MRKIVSIVLGGLVLAAAAKPAGAQSVSEILRLSGSNTIGEELAPALARKFAASPPRNLTNESVEVGTASSDQRKFTFTRPENPRTLEVDIDARGTGFGFPALRDHLADIAMASRPVKDQEEKDIVREPLQTNETERVIGKDGVLVLASPSNPIGRLTADQIENIFCGQIDGHPNPRHVTDWAQVGGHPGRIQVYRRNDASGTTDTFKALAMPHCPGSKPFPDTARELTSSEDLSDSVADDPNGIGYTGFAYRRRSKAVDVAGTCGLAAKASEFTVKTEEYPLSRRLFLYSPLSRQTDLVKEFLSFATLNPVAQQAVLDTGFINLQMVVAEPGYAATRPPAAIDPETASIRQARNDYLRVVESADRISVGIRFRSGSADLDGLASDNITRIAEENAKGQLGNHTLYLLGFTDNVGKWEDNRALSQARAEAVARVLRSRGVSPVVARGLSFLVPVACNDAALSNNLDWGKERNRRVEAWLARQ
jgi:phosphate transport system substrate-binding protein